MLVLLIFETVILLMKGEYNITIHNVVALGTLKVIVNCVTDLF